MPPIIPLTFCVVLVAVLLQIERHRHQDVSLALWVPTLWMLIHASRPLGRWVQFQYAPITSEAVEASIEIGSPLDRWGLSTLIIFALIILLKRQIDWSRILKDNKWLILIYLYLGISILWSEIPFVSFKRFNKSAGDILMALVVLSERLPLQALESILRRCAYVLIPLSVVLIKYYPNLGVEYSRWAGELMWTGVTTQKNSLGQLCTLSAFLFIWALLRDWKSEKPFKTSFQTYADVLVLAIGIFLLRGPGKSYSATSGGSLIVGVTILLLLYWRTNLAKVVARHLKSIMVSFTLTFIFLYDSLVKIVAPILGRDETLTGRTDIWRPILDFASRNPIFGVGYGGFWSPDNSELEKMVGSQFILAQAHNGYIAVYVELGIVGILLLALFLLHYCDKVQRELNHSFEWGVYGICILILSMLYNNTEISFLQSSSYLWSTMVFLTVVFSASCLDTTKKEM